jgi:hypothetical protein
LVTCKSPLGKDFEAADPEIGALFRRFQGMSKEAREQIKQLFEAVDAMDRKKATASPRGLEIQNMLKRPRAVRALRPGHTPRGLVPETTRLSVARRTAPLL